MARNGSMAAGLLLAGAAQAQTQALIVPGERIGPFGIGMNDRQIKSVAPSIWREGSYQDFDVDGGKLIAVTYGDSDGRVARIETNSPLFRTREAVGTSSRALDSGYQGRKLKRQSPPPFVGDFHDAAGIGFFTRGGIIEAVIVCGGTCP